MTVVITVISHTRNKCKGYTSFFSFLFFDNIMKYLREANFIKTRELLIIISQFGRLKESTAWCRFLQGPHLAPSSLAGSHSRGKKSHLETRKQMGVVVHAYDPSIWEVEAGRWRVKDQPWLHSKFKARQSPVRVASVKLKNGRKAERLGPLFWW